MKRNRIGQKIVVRKNLPREYLVDIYHQVLHMKWRYLLLYFFVFFLIVNFIFALLYHLAPDGISNHSNSFLDSFFFSVQTFSTIGFGSLSPHSLYANILVTIEAMLGLICVALMTGIVFSKFAQAKAKVLFSNDILVSTFQGKPTLMFRVANARTNQIVNAQVHLTLLRDIKTQEGQEFREFTVLKLVKEHTPVFYLSMTVMHVIDETSPLYGISLDMMEKQDLELIVNLSGLDGTFGQTIHSQFSYKKDNIVFGGRFADILSKAPNDVRVIDYSHFHTIIKE